MSLVNDMLRDLDQRRKESTGSASSVALTPAPEIPRDPGKRSITIYIVLALILGAGAVAWFWTQQGGSSTTRQLEIAPTVVSEPATNETIEQSNANATATANSPQLDSTSTARSSAILEQSVAETTATVAESTGVILGQQTNSLQAEDSALLEQDSNPTEPTAVTLELASQDATARGSEILEDDELPIEGDEPNSLIAQNVPVEVDLSEQPAQEVKNSAELSPEERDLLAVQEALRLIADNELAAAYSSLEGQILTNRYAHQSRETYAKLLMSEGNLLGAYELNEAGLALSPNHSGFKKVKARILIADGQLDEAVQLLLSRAPAVDVDLEYHDILATAQLASRDYAGALISYTELVQQDQGQGKWWYGFAASQDSLGNTSAARQGYSQAVAMPNLSASLRRRSQERLAILSQ